MKLEIANVLKPFHEQVLVVNIRKSRIVSDQFVSAEILLFFAVFNNILYNVIVAHVVLPLVKPAARNQIKGVVKFAPVSLV